VSESRYRVCRVIAAPRGRTLFDVLEARSLYEWLSEFVK